MKRFGHKFPLQRVGHHVVIDGKVIGVRSEGKMLDRPQPEKQSGPAQQEYQEQAVVPEKLAPLYHFPCDKHIWFFALKSSFVFFVDRFCGIPNNGEVLLKKSKEGIHESFPDAEKI
jgi:hypothetical protein